VSKSWKIKLWTLLFVFLLIFFGCATVETPVLEDSQQVRRVAKDLDFETLFVGDIMLGRFVETLANRHGDSYPFVYLPEIRQQADLLIGNLEGPITETENHRQTPDFSTSFSFPQKVAKVLADVGFEALSLANNHTFDRGEASFEYTKAQLRGNGIAEFGHPLDPSLGSVFVQDLSDLDKRLVVIGLHAATVELDVVKAVDLIKSQNLVPERDLIVVYPHWGPEYVDRGTDRQRAMAEAFIDAGADLIIGHHPHVIQNVETYKNKPIIYSLGNFVFDQYFSVATQQGLAVRLKMATDGYELELMPLEIIKSQPQLFKDQGKSDYLLLELAKRSSEELASRISSGKLKFSY
jgi:poly-gamma-glutamate synthesis protein (capsule biosynthesis protein)